MAVTVEQAIISIDTILNSDYHYDESLGYQLTSDDFDWLELAKESLMKQQERLPITVMNGSPVDYHDYDVVCPRCDSYLDDDQLYCSQLAHLAYTNSDDIVKITKCKDCKYFHTYQCHADNTGLHTYCELNILGYNENDYCSCALPKEN